LITYAISNLGDLAMNVLITGSCGLIGSEAVIHYCRHAKLVVGIDNNMRAQFFGPDGDTIWVKKKLEAACSKYRHLAVDIRDQSEIPKIIKELRPDLIIHCAAQPSHDWAARIPFIDFEVNAMGTLNLLEASRQWAPDAVFIFMSTNKVYGDSPNRITLKELETRWDYEDKRYVNGIPESFSIDQSKHSLFGASKVAADVLVQEYGRYFGMKTVAFRGGCLTGPKHSGAELHGFLSYLFKTAVSGKPYTIFGYKGKQVRDQIHSADVIAAFDEFYRNPKCGEVYNIGGGKQNSISVLEAIEKIEQVLGKKIRYDYSEENRKGDHICYYSDLTKLKTDFPNWSVSYTLEDILVEFAESVF
jgi:CDP-paratose 2-epimerase